MTTEALQNLIEDPDVFSLGIDAGAIREVLVEIATRVDALQYKVSKSTNDQDPYDSDEIREINMRLNEMKKTNDQQMTDFNNEVKELKQFFNYQIKDLRESIDKNNRQLNDRIMSIASEENSRIQTPVKQELPVPQQATPTPKAKPEVIQSPMPPKSDDLAIRKLTYDVQTLRERIDSLISSIDLMKEDDEPPPLLTTRTDTNNTPREKEAKVEQQNDGNKLEDTLSDLSNSQIISPLKIENKEPPHNDEPPLKLSAPPPDSSVDDKFQDVYAKLNQLYVDTKSSKDQITNIKKTTNKIIIELDQHNKSISSLNQQNSNYVEDLEKLRDKLTDVGFSSEKKILDLTELVNSLSDSLKKKESAEGESKEIDVQQLQQDIQSAAVDPAQMAAFQKMVEDFKYDVEQNLKDVDSNFRTQIHYIKQEITNLKSSLRAITPKDKQRDMKLEDTEAPEMKPPPSFNTQPPAETEQPQENKPQAVFNRPKSPKNTDSGLFGKSVSMSRTLSTKNPPVATQNRQIVTYTMTQPEMVDRETMVDPNYLKPIPITRVSFGTPLGSYPNAITTQFVLDKNPAMYMYDPRRLPQTPPNASPAPKPKAAPSPPPPPPVPRRVTRRKKKNNFVTVSSNTPPYEEGPDIPPNEGYVEEVPQSSLVADSDASSRASSEQLSQESQENLTEQGETEQAAEKAKPERKKKRVRMHHVQGKETKEGKEGKGSTSARSTKSETAADEKVVERKRRRKKPRQLNNVATDIKEEKESPRDDVQLVDIAIQTDPYEEEEEFEEFDEENEPEAESEPEQEVIVRTKKRVKRKVKKSSKGTKTAREKPSARVEYEYEYEYVFEEEEEEGYGEYADETEEAEDQPQSGEKSKEKTDGGRESKEKKERKEKKVKEEKAKKPKDDKKAKTSDEKGDSGEKTKENTRKSVIIEEPETEQTESGDKDSGSDVTPQSTPLKKSTSDSPGTEAKRSYRMKRDRSKKSYASTETEASSKDINASSKDVSASANTEMDVKVPRADDDEEEDFFVELIDIEIQTDESIYTPSGTITPIPTPTNSSTRRSKVYKESVGFSTDMPNRLSTHTSFKDASSVCYDVSQNDLPDPTYMESYGENYLQPSRQANLGPSQITFPGSGEGQRVIKVQHVYNPAGPFQFERMVEINIIQEVKPQVVSGSGSGAPIIIAPPPQSEGGSAMSAQEQAEYLKKISAAVRDQRFDQIEAQLAKNRSDINDLMSKVGALPPDTAAKLTELQSNQRRWIENCVLLHKQLSELTGGKDVAPVQVEGPPKKWGFAAQAETKNGMISIPPSQPVEILDSQEKERSSVVTAPEYVIEMKGDMKPTPSGTPKKFSFTNFNMMDSQPTTKVIVSNPLNQLSIKPEEVNPELLKVANDMNDKYESLKMSISRLENDLFATIADVEAMKTSPIDRNSSPSDTEHHHHHSRHRLTKGEHQIQESQVFESTADLPETSAKGSDTEQKPESQTESPKKANQSVADALRDMMDISNDEGNAHVFRMQGCAAFYVDAESPEQHEKFNINDLDLDQLAIPRYDEQIRIMRDTLVEMRTNVQLIKQQTDERFSQLINKQMQFGREEFGADPAQLNAFKKSVDSRLTGYESDFNALRQELYQFMKDRPERIVEKVKEVVVEKPEEEQEKKKPKKKKQDQPPPPPPPPDINIDLQIKKQEKLIGQLESPRIFNVQNLEVVHSSDDEDSDDGVIVENKDRTRPYNAKANVRKRLQVTETGEEEETAEAAAKKTNRPNSATVSDNEHEEDSDDDREEGHVVPQLIDEVSVYNALPKTEYTDKLVPMLMKIRDELKVYVDVANNRTLKCDKALKNKCNKDYVETFFKRIRTYLEDYNQKIGVLDRALPLRVTKDELEDRLERFKVDAEKEFYAQPAAANGTYTRCLFCGSKIPASKADIPNPESVGGKPIPPRTNIVSDKGIVYKGRVSGINNISKPQLPPMNLSNGQTTSSTNMTQDQPSFLPKL